MAEEALAKRLYRVYITVCEMLTDRNYIVDPDMLNMDFDTFREQHSKAGSLMIDRAKMTMLVRRQTDRGDQIYVFFESGPLGKQHIGQIVARLEDVKRCILVVGDRLTPSAAKTIEEMQPQIIVEYFPEHKLLVNITQHVLVPLHQPLSKDDADAVLKRYRLTKQQLPRMLYEDPIARWFGMKRGEVVKITRTSETAGRYVTYRLVF